MATALPALLDRLLTRDATQRIRLAHAGLASTMMLLAALVMHLWTWLGVNDGTGLWIWSAASVLGLFAMFLGIRLGWTARLADPSLAMPQLLYAVACAAIAYRIAGAGHGASLLLVALVLMFGMFGLPRGQSSRIAAFSIVAFALAMYSGARDRPEIYAPRTQAGYFVAFVVFVCGFLAVNERVAAMRKRMRSQRKDLATALERINQLATHDELTGLLNRRAMGALLDAEQHRSLRAGHRWSVAILDVDHFKRVNDLHGHAGGDEALRAVARVCSAATRACDAVSRWGGEEYVLLFRDVDLEHSLAAAERIRTRLEATPVRFGSTTFGVTVSIGVAQHVLGEDAANTLSRADRALYDAKAAGRNRVLCGPGTSRSHAYED